MGAAVTHGTPFRRAAEEGLFLEGRSMHVGIRGSIPEANDLVEDEEMGFKIISCRYSRCSGTTRQRSFQEDKRQQRVY